MKAVAVVLSVLAFIFIAFFAAGCSSNDDDSDGSLETQEESARITFNENDLYYFIGASSQEIIKIFGQPSSASIEGRNLVYPYTGEPGLILSLSGDVVNDIFLASGDWTLCGLRIVNSKARIDRAMNEIGAIDSGYTLNPDTGETHYLYSFSYSGGQFNLVFIVHPDEGNAITLEAVTMPSRSFIPSAQSVGGALRRSILGIWDVENIRQQHHFNADGTYLLSTNVGSLSGYFEISGNTLTLNYSAAGINITAVYEDVHIDGDTLSYSEAREYEDGELEVALGEGTWSRVGDSSTQTQTDSDGASNSSDNPVSIDSSMYDSSDDSDLTREVVIFIFEENFPDALDVNAQGPTFFTLYTSEEREEIVSGFNVQITRLSDTLTYFVTADGRIFDLPSPSGWWRQVGKM